MRALAWLLMLWPVVAAASPRRWAIGEIRVAGDDADGERAALEERAWRALSLALPTDAWVAPHEAVERALAEAPALRGCAEDRCNLALGDRLDVERLVTLRLERRGRDRIARLLAYAVDAAEVAGTLEVPCPRCDADALLEALARAAAPLLRDERAHPLCRLTVTGAPGATVRVDTVALGTAPFAHTVAAGRHTVAVDGGAAAEVECAPGATRALALAAAVPPARPRARAWRVALGLTAAALALASAAGMATAAAYHGRAACDGGRCAYRYDATAGIATGAVGVAAFSVAAGLLLSGARTPAGRAAAAAVDANGGGAFGVGLAGRF